MRKFALLGIFAFAFVLVTGCAKPVHKDWIPVGGSKSDATIKLAFNWNPVYEKPETEQQQALELAKRKCQTWGYESAEPFGGVLSQCSQMTAGFGGMQCVQMTATQEFQCIGGTTMTQTGVTSESIKSHKSGR